MPLCWLQFSTWSWSTFFARGDDGADEIPFAIARSHNTKAPSHSLPLGFADVELTQKRRTDYRPNHFSMMGFYSRGGVYQHCSLSPACFTTATIFSSPAPKPSKIPGSKAASNHRQPQSTNPGQVSCVCIAVANCRKNLVKSIVWPFGVQVR